MKEQWKDVVRYEGLYKISNIGRIKRIAPGKGAIANKVLRTSLDNHGYPKIMLYGNGKRKNCSVHRIVLEAFVGPCPCGMESCHNDGNPLNVAVSNLRWDTHKSNIADRIKHGTQNDQRGSKNNNAKLDESQVLIIRCMLESGKYLQKEIAKQFEVSNTVIVDINTGKSWRHVDE